MYTIISLIIGDAVDVQTLLRPALLPRDIANLPNSHLAPTAKELIWTSSKDELCHSRQGLKCREWLMSHEWSSCDHCSHFWVGLGYRTCIVCSLAHSYLDHTLKTSLNADSSALVPNCHMDISEPVPNCPDISDPSRWCRSVLGPKCLYTVHAVAGAWFIRTLQ